MMLFIKCKVSTPRLFTCFIKSHPTTPTPSQAARISHYAKWTSHHATLTSNHATSASHHATWPTHHATRPTQHATRTTHLATLTSNNSTWTSHHVIFTTLPSISCVNQHVKRWCSGKATETGGTGSVKEKSAKESEEKDLKESEERDREREATWWDNRKDEQFIITKPTFEHYDESTIGTERNPIGLEADDQKEFYFRGKGRYLIYICGLLAFMVVERLSLSYNTPKLYIVEGKEEKLFSPILLTTKSDDPTAHVISVFLKYYGLCHEVSEDVPQSLPASSVAEAKDTSLETRKLPRISLGGGEFIMNDCNMVLNLISVYLNNSGRDSMWEILDRYPFITYDDCIWDVDFTSKLEVIRRFITNSHQYSLLSDAETLEKLGEGSDDEEGWRRWCDDVMIPLIFITLHSNLTQSLYNTLRYCNEQEWSRGLSPLCRIYLYPYRIVKYVFSAWRKTIMWKQRLNVDDDGLERLMNELKDFMTYVSKRRSTDQPLSISEITVYGILNKYEFLPLIPQLLSLNKDLTKWYQEVKGRVEVGEGHGHLDMEVLQGRWRSQRDDKDVREYTSKRDIEKRRVDVEDLERHLSSMTTDGRVITSAGHEPPTRSRVQPPPVSKSS